MAVELLGRQKAALAAWWVLLGVMAAGALAPLVIAGTQGPLPVWVAATGGVLMLIGMLPLAALIVLGIVFARRGERIAQWFLVAFGALVVVQGLFLLVDILAGSFGPRGPIDAVLGGGVALGIVCAMLGMMAWPAAAPPATRPGTASNQGSPAPATLRGDGRQPRAVRAPGGLRPRTKP